MISDEQDTEHEANVATNLPVPLEAPETEADAEPRILDAVQDNRGGRWIRFGTEKESGWVGIADLQINEKEVYRLLITHGVTLLTTGSRNSFKAEIEAHKQYRPAVVASQPGWIPGTYIYVYGDGAHSAPSGVSTPEVIVTFEPNAKFTPRGTPTGWHEAVAPVVNHQPVLVFAINYGLLGPFLRFAPSDFTNPLAEIVGRREGGKSTALALAASASAGDPTSDTGGAESWNLTLHFLDAAKHSHADGLLGLDELNLAGSNKADQKTVAQFGAFRIATTGSRKRLTDTASALPTKLATLSTSNLPLVEMVDVDKAILEAIESRMLTVQIPDNHPYGVLAEVPKGFRNSREAAIEHLRSAVDREYGTAIREIIPQLIKRASRNEYGLRETIRKKLAHYEGRIERVSKTIPKRVLKTLALVCVVGWFAWKWKVIPKSWGHPLSAILRLLRAGQIRGVAVPQASALTRIRAYAKENAKGLVKVADLKQPLTQSKFAAAAGFLRKQGGATELLVPSAQLQSEFPDIKQMMRKLKKAGRAKTEGGPQTKLTIKAPKAICATGRVYCIRISS